MEEKITMKCHNCGKEIDSDLEEEIGDLLCDGCFKLVYPDYDIHRGLDKDKN